MSENTSRFPQLRVSMPRHNGERYAKLMVDQFKQMNVARQSNVSENLNDNTQNVTDDRETAETPNNSDEDVTDSREKLEADVREWVDDIGWLSDKETQVADFIAWLDRQDRITYLECMASCNSCVYRVEYNESADEVDRLQRRNDELRTSYDKLNRKLDNLAHDLRESERLREEMREELSIAYDHAHDLLSRRDRGLE